MSEIRIRKTTIDRKRDREKERKKERKLIPVNDININDALWSWRWVVGSVSRTCEVAGWLRSVSIEEGENGFGVFLLGGSEESRLRGRGRRGGRRRRTVSSADVP